MANMNRGGTPGGETSAGGTDAFAEARAALREVVPELVGLVRSIPDPNAASIGTWRVGDVAAHLSHVFRTDSDALAERPLPRVTVTTAGMAELTATWLAEDSERHPPVLADRIDELADTFDEIASRCTSTDVGWLQGARLAPAAVTCHLLEECLVHGHDIAKAMRRPWPIRRRHALQAVEGGALPIIAALPPTAFLNQERARTFRARFDIRLRGGGRTQLVFDDGSLKLASDTGDNADAHVSAEASSLMLVFFGRQGIWKPIASGKLTAWGPRPWKLVRMLDVTSLP